ncbi:hypothetical protein ACH5RR_014937 [Cinchona calisaya]|uniref:Eukaryotic translation initiation factor-related n=1 Tax=Cinchona calisaya TaxID=153742 RepID=A0ABD2ZS49_9GENT
MSKKKATMTLKDFHGGSIPSDLPLPSAPGVMARPSERGGFDRQAAWGNQMGRSDHRLRPGSAGTGRSFDDKTPFLSHSTHIGRNFDEDERKPLDGVSGPRRTVSDESLRALPNRVVEPKTDYSASGRVPSRPSSTPGSQYSSGTVGGSYAGKFNEVSSVGGSSQGYGASSGVGLNYQNVGGSGGQMVSGPPPNAWGVRKEAATIKESAPDAALKLAHASALEKVSSGRWYSKQPDVEIIRQPEVDSDFHFGDKDKYSKNTYNVVGGIDYHEASLVNQVEKSLTVDDVIHGGSKELPTYERARAPVPKDANERNPLDNVNGFRLPHQVVKLGGTELQSAVNTELSERPKLKLLPRSKPLENLEPPMENKPVYQQPAGPVEVENHSQSFGMPNPLKPGFVGSESGNAIVERPKLNLKPRSGPLEPQEGDTESKRNTLFGGARPRELVLQERGIDNVAVKNDDVSQPPHRIKQDIIKIDKVPVHATSTRYNDKPENIPIEHRPGKNSDRRDHRLEVERTDVQKKNWRNKRDFENQHQHQHQHQQQQQQQQQQERPLSPETWRKPVEHPEPAPADASGLRYGKAASPVELAQAFSRSISDSTTADRFSGQRGPPSRGQIPFSRLTGPTPRAQLNGY